MDSPQQHNRRAWDERVRSKGWYVDTATEKDFQNPLAVVDQCGWLGGSVVGKRLLCLAAGGGRHSVLFATAGAEVTVVDLSPAALELDYKIARERKLDIRIVEASMDNLAPLADASFDVVIQPVSACYVPDISAVYREAARVIRPGGIYISQHKQPVSAQTSALPAAQGYTLAEPYYRSGPLPPAGEGFWHRESGALEFLHRWDQLLGGLCRAGFSIEDAAEPRHGDLGAAPGSFAHRSAYAPPYIKLKARRHLEAEKSSRIWIPS